MNYQNAKIVKIAVNGRETCYYDCTALDLQEYAESVSMIPENTPAPLAAILKAVLRTCLVEAVLECPCSSDQEMQEHLRLFKLYHKGCSYDSAMLH